MVIMIVCVFALIFIGVPVAFALGGGALIAMLIDPRLSIDYLAQYMYGGFNSFPLVSLPFFMLAGTIMEGGDLSRKLVNAANSLVGQFTGGLGYVTILACMLFGGISGSSPATVAAIGAVMIPQMIRAGYDKYYATALVTVAGGLGVIVPPSYPLVIYGVTNSVSIGNLFVAAIGPAIVVGVLLAIMNYIFCRKNGYKGSGEKFSLRRVAHVWWDAKWAVIMPLIILGGIYSGLFTPTEAAIVACFYGMLVSVFVEKTLTLKGLWDLIVDNMPFMGSVLATFPFAAQVAVLFSIYRVSGSMKNFFSGLTDSYALTMLVIFVILILAGMFIETTPITIILSPVLLNVVKMYGMNEIQFGLTMTLACCIAFCTPPVASNLFVSTSLTGLRMEKIAIKSVPFVLMMLVAWLLVTFIPQITLFIVGG